MQHATLRMKVGSSNCGLRFRFTSRSRVREKDGKKGRDGGGAFLIQNKYCLFLISQKFFVQPTCHCLNSCSVNCHECDAHATLRMKQGLSNFGLHLGLQTDAERLKEGRKGDPGSDILNSHKCRLLHCRRTHTPTQKGH